MKLKKIIRRIAFSAAALASAGMLTTACIPLDSNGDGTVDLGDALDLGLAGVTPDGTNSDGNVSFSVVPEDSNGDNLLGENLQTAGMDVEVRNDDGSFSDCDHVGTEIDEGSEWNTLALVIDDSGSMERSYPEEEYGNLCLTCPHDPDRKRAEATGELIDIVLDDAPQSRLAVMDFGPFVDDGKIATRVLEDFTNNPDALVASLDQVDGSLEAGTPLWDSLAETITGTDEEAEDYQDTLQVEDRRNADGTPAEVRRVIVVLSDGDDRDSTEYDLEKVIALANTENVTIHAIGLGPAAAQNDDPRLQVDEQVTTVTNLQKLAAETGGFYASVNDPEALNKLYETVAKSLTKGYQVETYKCEPKPSKDAPDSEKREPESGEKVDGRMSSDGANYQSWSYIAP